jgi:hypothetical protein
MAAALPHLHEYWAARDGGPGAAGREARSGAEAEVRTTRIWRRSSIGAASLDADGAITLDLRASDGRGILGDARLVCPKGDPRYADLLAHLGGLVPGESKPVPPWPAQR